MGQRHHLCHCARSSSSRVRLLVERKVIYIHSVTYEYLLYIQACTIYCYHYACDYCLLCVPPPPLDSSEPFPISPISYNRALCCQEHTLTLTFLLRNWGSKSIRRMSPARHRPELILRLFFQNLCCRRPCFIKAGWGWQDFNENTDCNRYWLFKASKYNDPLFPFKDLQNAQFSYKWRPKFKKHSSTLYIVYHLSVWRLKL